ncbi:hypothetical protein L1277_002217 [Okibacterium sp. HSC-33S16]|uniref:hypothetical protein n=1 Tax=Okibacterium sp. HSC-33S16 TaxID=2910965 RepID=UPI00209E7DF7|nr:hypothetical protein [Okibacterium sp. HSC-33S16]MCP2032118.1 hypothetical protein [Okibacterium sp. HSC-33S16]
MTIPDLDAPTQTGDGPGPERPVARALGKFALIILGVAVVTVTVLGGAIWVIGWFFSADTRAEGAATDDFVAFAEDLPGVASATAAFGLADTFVDATDIYSTVTLHDDCTSESMRATATSLLPEMSPSGTDFRVHPDVICGAARVTVSPATTITDQRFSLLSTLLDDPAVATAAVRSPQQGDDAQVDEDNAGLLIEIGTTADATLAAVLETWLSRSAELTPEAQLVVGGPANPESGYLRYLSDDVRQVSIRAGREVPTGALAAVRAVEDLEFIRGFSLSFAPQPSELRVLVDEGMVPDALSRLAPVSSQFETVNVTQ